MAGGSLSKRYARAMIELAKEEDQLDLYGDDLQRISDLIETYPDFHEVLVNTSFPRSKRQKVLSKVMEKMEVEPLVRNFCSLLLSKERMGIIGDIVREYLNIKDEITGVARADVASAADVSKGTLQRIERLLSRTVKKKVVVSHVVDPELIGGLVLQMGDKLYDGSIRSEFRRIREKMMQEMT